MKVIKIEKIMENQDIKNISIFKKIIIKLRIFLFGKIKYKDKFGLSYFLWPNAKEFI